MFGVHPLHVESVAWAAERKDVLSTFFFLLTLWAYARYAGGKSSKSKVQGPRSKMVWPGVAVVRAGAHEQVDGGDAAVCLAAARTSGRWRAWPCRGTVVQEKLPITDYGLRTLLLEKLPFIALSIVFALITVHAQKTVDAISTTAQFPIATRVQNAVWSYVTYLRETLWPHDLAAYYPYPNAFPFAAVAGAGALIIGVSALAFRVWRGRPYFLFGWLWYLATLLPVIGLVQVGGQSHADRYTYMPLIGVFVGVAWAGYDAARRWPSYRVLLAVVACVITGVCSALTWRQIGFWKDSETLFAHALAVTKDNQTAHCNLGSALASKGRLDEAIFHLQEALRLAPDSQEARASLGAALAKNGRLDEGLLYLNEAVKKAPRNASAAISPTRWRCRGALTRLFRNTKKPSAWLRQTLWPAAIWDKLSRRKGASLKPLTNIEVVQVTRFTRTHTTVWE